MGTIFQINTHYMDFYGPIFAHFKSGKDSMKYQKRSIVLYFLLFVIMTGCKKNIVISDRQSILFEYEYINYAWNYKHHGFLIDNEGNVLTYNNPESWNFPDRELRISESQVAENLSMCNHSGIRVPKSELQKYANHIKNIASSRVSAPKNEADDSGSAEYICYQYSENSGIYKGTIIKMEGDFTCENLNFYSRKVAEWMKNINDSIPLK
jgi:hypothetical protein